MEDKAEHEIAAGRRRIIERPRLTRLLDETPARVIMLVAPAGYGKTTLARQWVADRPHAWYQGGPSSPDVAALSLGLAEASEALVSDVGRRLREWLPTSRAPEDEVHVIEQFLADDLADLPDDAWFVVDDYHLLTSAAAEDLIRRLFISGNRRLLLTSRQRPAWASARALLYGSFFELGQNALAMNMEEANAVLASRHAEAARGLFALADGWPAVIGLAALTPTTIKLDEEFPDELYDYFAEELFASLPEDIQDGICRLALVPVVDRVAAEAILGPGAERVVTVAREAGMFTFQRAQELALHPLLRTFLLHKLVEMPRPEVREAVTRGTEHLIGVESWDEAFSLISEFERHELLDSLLCRAIIPLTKQGRLATLRHWLDFARLHEMASPYLDLADAELSFRQGLYDRAEMLAQSAARGMSPQRGLKSASYYRAGQSCLLVDEMPRALDYFREARETAESPFDSRNALWGEFTASLELERSDASDRLQEFTAVAPHDRDTTVRTAAGRLSLAMRTGGLTSALSDATAAVGLVHEAADPIVRTSFWNIYAAGLALAGAYAEALNAVDEALREVDSSSIEFARAHVLLSRATANVGLQRYRIAEQTLAAIEESARDRGDDYVLTNARAISCRLLLQTARTDAALGVIAHDWTRTPSPSMQAEFLATRAAALACARRPEAALDLANRVRSVSIYLEPRLLAQWVQAICGLLLESPEAEDQVRAAYESSRSTGALDTFVFAYRLHSSVLTILTSDSALHESIASLLARMNDSDRGDALGLRASAAGDPRAPHRLTKREREVYALLAEGKTNREIAETLVISEVTAKAHVRNVLRKLGVRSRTQAAIRAVREEIDER
jgi:LuxR family transcriptional regulator, maltose regulon positive regulatory protein